MEDSTQFDLNEAIRRWRQEVGESPAIGQEALRELESHLVDSVEALRGTGLSAEEAFGVARRRLGSAETLEQEFAKANPARVWLQRAVWMVTGFLLVNCASTLAGAAVTAATLLSHVLQVPSGVSNVVSAASLVLHYGVLTGLLWVVWRSANQSNGIVRRVGSRLQVHPVLTSVMVATFLLAVAILNMGVQILLVKILNPPNFKLAMVVSRTAVILAPIILWPTVLGWLLRRVARPPTAE